MTEKDLIRCELLVLRYQQDNRDEAANELVTLFEKPVLYYLQRMVESEADAWDLLQETFFSVVKSLPRMRDGRALPAFVYRVARNAALDHLRSKKHFAPMTDAVEQIPDHDSTSDFSTEGALLVHRTLEKLPLAQREVLTLFFLKDLSIEQIADVMNVPAGTVKSRLHYAKIALRQKLEVSNVRE